MTTTFVQSVCPHDCPSTCPLEVERLAPDRIGRVRGTKDDDYTQGVICAKVGRYAERVHHPDRLSTPLKRTGPKGNGQFAPISWDEALDTVAAAFIKATADFGAESVWPYRYAGTMGLVHRDGIDRLIEAKGYSRQHHTICSSVGKAAMLAGLGAARGADPREIRDADLIVFWGVNAIHTQVQTWNMAEQARKTRGARIVSIDPYRNRTAQRADLHLPIRPGSDGALACAMIQVMLAEGLADREFLAELTDFTPAMETHFQSRDPAWAAEITGLAEADIIAFAREYGSTARAFIRTNYGLTRNRNGAVNGHALSCLPAVSGAWRHPGGGFLMASGGCMPMKSGMGAALDTTLITGADIATSNARELDQSQIGAILCGEAAALKNGPPVTAMIIQNTNPAVVAPESAKVRDGFLREDLFLCVHEQFMTDTAKYADIVLPATSFLEHDDMYRSYGHTHMQVAKAVISPFAEARSNHDVLCALAHRLGAEHRGFSMTAWDIVDETLRASGFEGAEALYAQRWHDGRPPFEDSHFLSGFGHADGRFRFAPDWAAIGPDYAALPALPDHADLLESADAAHPFKLVTAPARNFLNSTFTETATSRKQEGEPTAYVHPDSVAAMGLVDGGRVRLGNARGSVVVACKAFDGLQTDTVVVESVWPNDAFDEGIGINVLVGADAIAPYGGAAFHDTAVWLRPA